MKKRLIFTLLILIFLSCKTYNNTFQNVVGEYKSSNTKERFNLTILENGEFKYHVHGELESSKFTEGKWKLNNDTIILNSKTYSQNDSMYFSLVSGQRLAFKNELFIIRKTKLYQKSSKQEYSKK